METMNIALPPEMKEFVRDEVSGGGYNSTSEYIRDLIRREQRRKAEARLETLLLEGINSGPMEEMTKQDWKDIRTEVRRRRDQRKTSGR